MMYGNKLAFAIKVNGRVLREFGDTVYVPFGTEYSILIKNLHTTRAVVNISIDGNSATKSGLVIDAGKEVELERFLGDNLGKGNKFKFIERTNAVEKHRGVKLEDGLVVVDYQFEQPVVHYNPLITYTYPTWPNIDISYRTNCSQKIGNNSNVQLTTSGIYSCNLSDARSADVTATANVSEQNEAGITVPGSISEQKFHTTYVGALEQTKHSMVIKLLGETDDNKPVKKPVTVNVKPKCTICGRKNKATSKFCSTCGTSLQIVA